MQCEICENNLVEIKKISHKILGVCDLIICQKCNHRSFYARENIKRKDDFFSNEYAKIQQHNDDLQKTIKSRRYFIDFSRLVLLSHFKFLDDGMKILELGPGFPGMFQQLKLTKKKFEFYASEPELESRKLLESYGVNVIGKYFPSSDYDSYMGSFDVIFACNILYYFDDPIFALNLMLKLLKKDGLILVDILNNEIMGDSYYKNNTMSHIFSKASLLIAIEKAGGRSKFLNTCCVKEPKSAFENIGKEANKKDFFKKLRKKVVNKLNVLNHNEVMRYFAQATQLKYGNPEGQYVRAIIEKKV